MVKMLDYDKCECWQKFLNINGELRLMVEMCYGKESGCCLELGLLSEFSLSKVLFGK